MGDISSQILLVLILQPCLQEGPLKSQIMIRIWSRVCAPEDYLAGICGHPAAQKKSRSEELLEALTSPSHDLEDLIRTR